MTGSPRLASPSPRVLFLDQTGALGGAEFSLLDVAEPYRRTSRVVLFQPGPFETRLAERGIPVVVLRSSLGEVRRETTGLGQLLTGPAVVRLATRVARMARSFDVLYANSQKALMVAAMAGVMARKPVVFHLHDILSPDHFSSANRWLSTTMANRFCDVVIADSHATRAAFVDAGGDGERCKVIYYGFEAVDDGNDEAARLRAGLNIDPAAFLVGHFSRLSPWKGQEVLVNALGSCSEEVVALLVGEAIFGEQDFVASLRDLIERSGLSSRVHLLGFRDDVSALMAACDVVVHSSTSAEPFGRVIVEAMLAGTPVVAADAGGPTEIIDADRTGLLTTPNDPQALARAVERLRDQPELRTAIAGAAKAEATRRFSMAAMHQGIAETVDDVIRGHAR